MTFRQFAVRFVHAQDRIRVLRGDTLFPPERSHSEVGPAHAGELRLKKFGDWVVDVQDYCSAGTANARSGPDDKVWKIIGLHHCDPPSTR